MAPFVPFLAEDVYKRTGGKEESVHLVLWPDNLVLDEKSEVENQKILTRMNSARSIVSLALEQRSAAGIKVRQPLAKLSVKAKKGDIGDLADIIRDEVNVKEISFDENLASEVVLDIVLTEELKEEGWVRELIRLIQDTRKTLGFDVNEKASLTLSLDDSAQKIIDKYKETIISSASLAKISFGTVEGGEVFEVGDMKVSLHLEH
jgi:isoleucyl-tRNA synthetase